MKKLIFASLVAFSFVFSSSAHAGSLDEIDSQYKVLKETTGLIVEANRSILQTLPSEYELGRDYSSKQLAKMITQLKNVMSANNDHLEILSDVLDTLYNVWKK